MSYALDKAGPTRTRHHEEARAFTCFGLAYLYRFISKRTRDADLGNQLIPAELEKVAKTAAATGWPPPTCPLLAARRGEPASCWSRRRCSTPRLTDTGMLDSKPDQMGGMKDAHLPAPWKFFIALAHAKDPKAAIMALVAANEPKTTDDKK